MKKALLILDMQNDFLFPEGALPIKKGYEIIPIINKLQPHFKQVIATKDWHPPDHISFASRHQKKPGTVIEVEGLIQELWPDHCVQESFGAAFPQSLDQKQIEKTFFKGVDREVDSYSAFFDNARRHSTGLQEFLKEKKIQELYIVGVAIDFCVRYTAHDALTLGYNVYVITDACRGIGLRPHMIEDVLEELSLRGVKLIDSQTILGVEIAREP